MTEFRSSKSLSYGFKARTKLEGHKGCINTCQFDNPGKRLLTGCDDGSVWMWEPGRTVKEPVVRTRPHYTNVFGASFLTDDTFVSGSNDAEVCVTKINNDGTTTTTRFSAHHVQKITAVQPIDSTTFLSTSYDGTLRLFDTRLDYNGIVETKPILTEKDYQYESYEFLVSNLDRLNLEPQGAGGGPIQKPASDNRTLMSSFPAPLYSISVHPYDRHTIAMGCGDTCIRFVDLRNNSKSIKFSMRHEYKRNAPVTGATYDSTGNRIAATVRYGVAHIIDIQAKTALCLTSHRSISTDKYINWLGEWVVSGSDDGKVYIYDPTDGKVVGGDCGVERMHKGNTNIVAVHQQSLQLATSGVDYYITLWGPTTLTDYHEKEFVMQDDPASRLFPNFLY
ncbi:hypothetical protein TVAG_041700 [Trichomonas vaginalis G3]|uniref:WD repeat protein n=1 Tax=Trichomonas vaginalis (strain ATCC PRA-98 / G3) TaxID=412133 RepID=A2FEW4_TRIV3|nr:protein modification by small protein conjugation or removal [Trichomonas vaginalis G3]EAX96568.1 hypothetical protein TVAG_041700 [Trichomonas vaginalis G3]KAI5509353.1 protein modification by small protein conjugation or removal [Trichomonas vaginalis G3]|eukprot:XP_001309498.1 hypothetical protein [Trichomonas vaginalis G3]